jgi:outer membrane lipoprotein carrier protein
LGIGSPTPETVALQIEAFYKDKGDIRARFLQRVKKPGRRRQLTKSGSVFFKRPGMMRWDYSKPERVFYISDGSVLWSYQPEDALVTRLDVHSSELYHQSRYLFGQGKISQDFKLSAGKNPTDDLYALVLKPLKSSRDFKSITLFVNTKSGEIRRTRLVDPYDNSSIIEFTKVSYKSLKEATFRFKPPANVTVRNLSRQGSSNKP